MRDGIPRAGVPDPIGKVARGTLERAVLSGLGAMRSDVVVGPCHGADAGIIDLGCNQVLAVTTDPFYVLPEVGWERAAWFAVHIVVSDLSTSGIAPAYLSVDLNLPPDLSDDDLAWLWRGVSAACAEIGVAVVTGHTGRYEGCAFPTVGGATAMGVGAADRYVTPRMARPGDTLVVTKGVAIETVGTIGAVFPTAIGEALGPEIAREAADLFCQQSVVRDAAVAVSVGVREQGVTAMHDATERGLWNAVVEITEASGHGVVVHPEAVPIPRAVRTVCALLDIDPFSASSEGTLVLTCRPDRVAAVLDRLGGAGIVAAAVGEIVPHAEGMRVADAAGARPLVAPREDPFWPAYTRVRERWRPG